MSDRIVDMGGRSENRRDPSERDSRARRELGGGKCECPDYHRKWNAVTGRCSNCFKPFVRPATTDQETDSHG